MAVLGYQTFRAETNADLRELVQTVQGDKHIAVDTEFVRETTYYPIFALLQISTRTKSYVIDPLLPELDLSLLEGLFKDPEITKIFHASRQDIEVFLKEFKIIPTPFVDTQILAQFCNFENNISLQKLCHTFFGVELNKEFQRMNWLKRPLPKKALAYALMDVEYLYHIHLKLKEMTAHKYVWFLEDMQLYMQKGFYEETPSRLLTKFKFGHGRFPEWRRQNLVHILILRNQIAKRLDCLPKHILSNLMCFELSDFSMNEVKERVFDHLICFFREAPHLFHKDQKKTPFGILDEEIEEVFEKEVFVPDPKLNKPRYTQKALNSLREKVNQIAIQQELETSLLARTKDLHDYLQGNDSLILQGWRKELLKGVL